jgi:hypothetical protein
MAGTPRTPLLDTTQYDLIMIIDTIRNLHALTPIPPLLPNVRKATFCNVNANILY